MWKCGSQKAVLGVVPQGTGHLSLSWGLSLVGNLPIQLGFLASEPQGSAFHHFPNTGAIGAYISLHLACSASTLLS